MQIQAGHAHLPITAVDTIELLLFRLGGDSHGLRNELFGFHVANVREIVAMPAVTALAGASPHVLGVVNWHGQVIEVLDLPALAGCVPASGRKIMLVTELGNATHAFALESVEEIVLIESNRVIMRQHGATGGIVAGIACLDDTASSARLAQVLDLGAIVRRVKG